MKRRLVIRPIDFQLARELHALGLNEQSFFSINVEGTVRTNITKDVGVTFYPAYILEELLELIPNNWKYLVGRESILLTPPDGVEKDEPIIFLIKDKAAGQAAGHIIKFLWERSYLSLTSKSVGKLGRPSSAPASLKGGQNVQQRKP